MGDREFQRRFPIRKSTDQAAIVEIGRRGTDPANKSDVHALSFHRERR
jgi:hypothetical protein